MSAIVISSGGRCVPGGKVRTVALPVSVEYSRPQHGACVRRRALSRESLGLDSAVSESSREDKHQQRGSQNGTDGPSLSERRVGSLRRTVDQH